MKSINTPCKYLAGLLGLFILCTASTVADDTPYRWRSVTVGGGGFAPNIIYSPAEQGLVYLRTDMGGVYRWDAAQITWLPLQDGMHESDYYGIESIAPDPVDPDVVHVAAGMYKRFPAAMMRSFDRGATWEITPVPFRMGGNEDGRGLGERLAVDPVNTDILYFGSRHDGLFRSTDRGLSWAPVRSFPHKGLPMPEGWGSNGGVSFVVFVPSGEDSGSTTSIIAGVADAPTAGVYRSDDRGATWQRLKGTPVGLFPVKAALGGGRLFVTFSDGIGPNGITTGAVFRLDLTKGVWADVTPPPPGGKSSRHEGGFMGLSVSRQDPNVVAVATINRWQPYNDVFRSTDGGEIWTGLSKNSRRDVSEYPFLYWGNEEAEFGWWIAGLAIDPFDRNQLVYTTGATVYRTLDASASSTAWKPWVKGIEQTACITLASLPEGPSLLSGFGDISGFVHTDFDQSPQVMFTGPVFANTNVIDYAEQSPNIVVRSGTQPHRGNDDDPTLAWSDDHGFSWKPVTVPPLEQLGKPAQRYDFSGNLPMVVSADGGTFVFMSPVPVVSTDRGENWTETKGLPAHARPVPDRSNPAVFYALDFDTSEFYVSRDGALSFERLDSKGLPQGIAEDRPTNREHRWPLMAAPGGEGSLWFVSAQGLFHSADGGLNFARRDARAGSQPLQVEQISFGKAAPGSAHPTMFSIGSREGQRAVWRSDDESENWYRVNDGDHEYGRRYRQLAGDMGRYGRVFLATDGRGIVVGEPRVEQHVLKNEHLAFSFTPALGGRGLSFSVPGHGNLLRVGEAVATDPEPVIAADGDNYPYLGHIVWIGPQGYWWQQQSLNAERREAGAVWPPDPYTVLVPNEIDSLDATSVELSAPASPVTGLGLAKRIHLEGDALVHEVDAVNTRQKPVSWDIWFNTRIDPDARVYVPVRDFDRNLRLETYEGEAAQVDPELRQAGFFGFSREGRFKAKAFIQPAEGWIAAFSEGQLFVIEFDLQPRDLIHPDHGQVELYLDSDLENGLLELELHAPYRTLQPGEQMSATERWHAWPSQATTIADQLAELP